MIIIADSSPLISLAAIHSLDLLPSLYTTIHIPEAVYREVVTEGAGRAGTTEAATATWIERHTITDQQAVQDLLNKANINHGESEVIVLATELKATLVIMDDLAARRTAQAQGLLVIGTIGILLLAKQRGLIPTVKKSIAELIAAGKYIHPALYNEALRQAGE